MAINDSEGYTHVLFYTFFIRMHLMVKTHLFTHSTFQCHPNIKNVAELLNVMNICGGTVRRQLIIIVDEFPKNDNTSVLILADCSHPNGQAYDPDI